MNTGWIKLHRTITDSEVFADDKAFKVFVWLLTNVDRKTGSMTIGRNWVSGALKMNPSTLYKVIKRLEKKYKIVTQESNNRFTTISLLNWDKYQSPETTVTQSSNNKVTTKEQQSNTLQEVKNKELRREHTRQYLLNIPLEDFSDIDATERQIKLEGEKAHNWCLAKGKKQKNYKAFLRNWVLKSFKKKKVEQSVVNEDYEVSPEGLIRIQEMKKRLMGPVKTMN